jgi:hypothetical protein
MSRCVNRRSIISVLITLTLAFAFASGVFLRGSVTPTHASGGTRYGAGNNNPICSRLGKSLQGSSGMQMFCFGSQSSVGGHQVVSKNASFGSNVNAANPSEDVSLSGTRADGQSETSIAGSGQYVVEAWNDSTSFISPTCSPMNKDQGTGFGFSNNAGKSFTDLGGLPNSNCATSRTEGDPSVEAYQVGGKTYFYISSIFIPFNVPENALSVTVCVVNGSGTSATLSCGNPIVAAISSQCGSSPSGFMFCSFLDKEFLTIDPVRAKLYMSYTEFGINFTTPDTLTNGQIELTACDISAPATPVCYNGSNGSLTGTGTSAAPYLVVAPGDLSCEREGAYPAVDGATGDVYVAHEFNWATNVFGSSGSVDCRGVQVKNQMDRISASCLTLPVASCTAPSKTTSVNISSMAATFIPGYNRFPMSDFPRIATSSKFGTVSMVWNDVGVHPAGDILMQSFSLGTLSNVQSTPVRLNADIGGWHFLPALRSSDLDGNLVVSWYQRNSATTTQTNVSAALALNPTTTHTPARNTLVTTGPTDWNGVSSLIIPNFGDYTDNYIIANSESAYIAWSDGRLGVPQPFNAHNLDVDI